jgi:serine/threonine protein phosphatase 1
MKHLHFELNTKGTDYFVGDLHGCYSLLMEHLAYNDFDVKRDRLFSVGDLIDRGDENEQCLYLLNNDWFFAVQGNHEDMMLGNLNRQIWYYNGGAWWETAKNKGELMELVRGMPYTMTVITKYGRIGVTHADAFGVWGRVQQRTIQEGGHTLPAHLWGRERTRNRDRSLVTGVDRVVVGHSVRPRPELLGNVLNIDTGAVRTGNLTVLSAKEVTKI